MIIKRDDRILDARYLSREGDTGTRWWSAMRGRNKLSVFNGSAIASEVALGGRPGQVVYSDSLTGAVFQPGASMSLVGYTALVTLSGVHVTSGFINRVNPTPPTGNTDSVRVLGSIPSIISWTVPVPGGNQMHPTQANTVNYYADLNGGGSMTPILERWWCVAAPVTGGLAVRIVQSTGAPVWMRLWAYASNVPFGGSVVSENTVAQLDDGTGVEAYGTGGTLSVSLIPP